MRITKKKQKLAVMEWIGEGLSSKEIDDRARNFDPPFTISRSQVDYYRKTRAQDLKSISHISEQTAMTEGYAKKEYRVYKLSLLAALMERDLLNGLLWTNEVKTIGSGPAAEIIDFEEFNKAEVEAYRGVLDDIAAETGGRIKKTELTGGNGGPVSWKTFVGDDGTGSDPKPSSQ
jgi:hypothetical protein